MTRGEVSLFLGGESSTLDLKPLFSAMVRSIFIWTRCFASRFKLVHNLVLGLHRGLGRSLCSLGTWFRPGTYAEHSQTISAASGVMQTKGRRMVEGDYEPQARLSQHLRMFDSSSEVTETSMNAPLSVTHQDLSSRRCNSVMGMPITALSKRIDLQSERRIDLWIGRIHRSHRGL